VPLGIVHVANRATDIDGFNPISSSPFPHARGDNREAVYTPPQPPPSRLKRTREEPAASINSSLDSGLGDCTPTPKRRAAVSQDDASSPLSSVALSDASGGMDDDGDTKEETYVERITSLRSWKDVRTRVALAVGEASGELLLYYNVFVHEEGKERRLITDERTGRCVEDKPLDQHT
jgi:hypothetical protein